MDRTQRRDFLNRDGRKRQPFGADAEDGSVVNVGDVNRAVAVNDDAAPVLAEVPRDEGALRRVNQHGWCHHIERLMVLGRMTTRVDDLKSALGL